MKEKKKKKQEKEKKEKKGKKEKVARKERAEKLKKKENVPKPEKGETIEGAGKPPQSTAPAEGTKLTQSTAPVEEPGPPGTQTWDAEGKAREVLRALGDPVRLQILELLRGGERCGADLLKSLSIGQPTLSHHMKLLCGAGAVCCRKAGRWSWYSVDPAGMEAASEFLAKLARGVQGSTDLQKRGKQ